MFVKESLHNSEGRSGTTVSWRMHLLEILLPKAKGILFGTFYRPPSQTDFMNPFRDVLESASAENKELIVTGDFNCDF